MGLADCLRFSKSVVGVSYLSVVHISSPSWSKEWRLNKNGRWSTISTSLTTKLWLGYTISQFWCIVARYTRYLEGCLNVLIFEELVYFMCPNHPRLLTHVKWTDSCWHSILFLRLCLNSGESVQFLWKPSKNICSRPHSLHFCDYAPKYFLPLRPSIMSGTWRKKITPTLNDLNLTHFSICSPGLHTETCLSAEIRKWEVGTARRRIWGFLWIPFEKLLGYPTFIRVSYPKLMPRWPLMFRTLNAIVCLWWDLIRASLSFECMCMCVLQLKCGRRRYFLYLWRFFKFERGSWCWGMVILNVQIKIETAVILFKDGPNFDFNRVPWEMAGGLSIIRQY